MSYRVTTKTAIQDQAAAEVALKKKGWDYRVASGSIQITTGPMHGSTINLQTGEVEGDSDFHGMKGERLSALNQGYGEAKVTMEVESRGGFFESQETLANGVLRMVAQVSMA